MNKNLCTGLLCCLTLVAACFEEVEPNNSHAQANRHNKHFYSKNAPLSEQGVAGELSKKRDNDIFYLRTMEDDNNISVKLLAEPTSPGPACVMAWVYKCKKRGVGNWHHCINKERDFVDLIYTCPFGHLPPKPTTQLHIGRNKLIRLVVRRFQNMPEAAHTSNYVISLVAD